MALWERDINAAFLHRFAVSCKPCRQRSRGAQHLAELRIELAFQVNGNQHGGGEIARKISRKKSQRFGASGRGSAAECRDWPCWPPRERAARRENGAARFRDKGQRGLPRVRLVSGWFVMPKPPRSPALAKKAAPRRLG